MGDAMPAKPFHIRGYSRSKVCAACLIAGSLTAWGSPPAPAQEFAMKTNDTEPMRLKLLPPGPNNPRNSEGDFIELKDGRILFIYTHFTGSNDDNASAHLASRVSADAGKTWSDKDEVVVSNEGAEDQGNVMSVSLLRLHDGRIALFYLRKRRLPSSKAGNWGAFDCRPVMRISTDEAKTWGPPKMCIPDAEIGFHVLNNSRVVQLKNGRLVMPIARHDDPTMPDNFNHSPRTSCWLSDDNGTSWHQSKTVLTGKHSPQDHVRDAALQEPGVVELKDGRLMMFCRTHIGYAYISFSGDQGETWSLDRPMPGVLAALAAPAIKRIPKTGDLLMVWDDHSMVTTTNHPFYGKRTPYTVAISRDEGRTWEKVKNIEDDPNGWYCYTAMDFVGDHVLLAHCAGQRDLTKNLSGLETIQMTRFSVDWLYK
jgi:sialidase-1